MRCPHCQRQLSDATARCDCAGARSADVALVARASELPARRDGEVALAEVVPMTPEARFAHSIDQGFRRLVGSPQLARPLAVMKRYWPVVVIPGVAGVVGIVGVQASLSAVGTAILWGLALAAQLLGNM